MPPLVGPAADSVQAGVAHRVGTERPLTPHPGLFAPTLPRPRRSVPQRCLSPRAQMPQRGNGMKPGVAASYAAALGWTSIHQAQPQRGCGIRPRPAGDSATPLGLTGRGVRSPRYLSPTARGSAREPGDKDGRREQTVPTEFHWRDDSDSDPEPTRPDRTGPTGKRADVPVQEIWAAGPRIWIPISSAKTGTADPGMSSRTAPRPFRMGSLY
jgi:hypothetical protein